MRGPDGLDVVGLFAGSGLREYGESVSQLCHALQCASLARRDRADDDVVIAALLHDVGHLIGGGVERPERHHGSSGAALVRPFVPARVAWLIEHHVVAKRYLCTVDPRYERRLSAASRRSYAEQGARLELDEQLELETRPWFGDALRLRRWDDAAKEPGAAPPPLIEYAPLLERYFGAQCWPAPRGLDRGA
ncbi:MAG TPA: HD domain-containing protein [Methylomirabilota bacterium]|nr:HD domain-containing protein [Methylomirabilota bacterium]